MTTQLQLVGLVVWMASLSAFGFDPIKIAELNDIHISDSFSTNYPARILQEIDTEHAACVLVAGDLATDGTEDQLRLAKGVLDTLKTPYYVVRGNHDGDEKLFGKVFELKEATYEFDVGGLHGIALDPGFKSDWKKKYVEPDMMEKLKSIAAKLTPDQPLIIFCHYPFAKIRYQIQNSQETLEAFKGRKLLAIISGHYHGNTENFHDGVLLTTTACASSTRNNHDKTSAKGYRVFEIDKDLKVTTRFQEVPGGELIQQGKPKTE